MGNLQVIIISLIFYGTSFSLTIQEAVEYSLKSPFYENRERIYARRAQDEIAHEKSKYLPKIELNLNSQKDTLFDLDIDDSYDEYNIELTQSLYIPSAAAKIDNREIDLRLSKVRLESTIQNQILITCNLYLDLYNQQMKLVLNDENRKSIKLYQHQLEMRYKAGEIDITSIIPARLNSLRREKDRHNISNQISSLRRRLEYMIRKTIKGTLELPDIWYSKDILNQENKLDAYTYKHTRNKISNEMTGIRREYLPTIDIFSSYQKTNRETLSRGDRLTMGVRVNFTLFDKLSKSYKVDFLYNDLEELTNNYKKSRDDSILEIELIESRIDQYQHTLELLTKYLDHHRDFLKMLKARESAGEDQVEDILSAYDRVYETEIDILDHKVAHQRDLINRIYFSGELTTKNIRRKL